MAQQAPSTTEAANNIVDIPFTSRQEPSGLADEKGDLSSVHQVFLNCKKADKKVEHTPQIQNIVGEKDGEKDSEGSGETKCEKVEKDQNFAALAKTPVTITKNFDSSSNSKPETLKIVWRPLADINFSTSFSAKKRNNKTGTVKTNMSATQAFTCGTCKKKFDTIHILEKHKLEDHGAVDKYKCQFCCITYLNKRGLSKHVKRDHPGSQKAPHQCALCELAFPDRESLAKHAKARHPVTYMCEFCQRVFQNRTRLNKHVEEMHVKNEDGTVTNRGFECESCKQVFKTPTSLGTHVSAFCKNSTREEKTFSCKKCDKTFWNSILFKIHHKKVHKEQIDPSKMVSYKCHMCSKTFISPAALRIHRCHHPRPKFKCQHCDKLYKNQTCLTEHIEVMHSDKKPEYTCEQCGKVYNRLRSLKFHQQEHVNGKKMYKCAFCPKQYTSKQSVAEHEGKHRGEQALCPQCGKNFASFKILRTHERSVHLNKKNHVCTICSKAYHDSYNLKCHMDLHTGSRNLKCRYCDKTFIYSSARALHQKTQHPKQQGEYMRKFRERNKVEIIHAGEVGGEICEAEGDGMEGVESGKTDDAAEIPEDTKESDIDQNHSDSSTNETSINEMGETKSNNEMDDKFEDTEMSEEKDSSKDSFF